MEELCIKNGTIVTMNPEREIIQNGVLVIKGPGITYCGPADGARSSGGNWTKEVDARGGLILPGLINGHTHAAMTLMRGLADDLPLETWLSEHIFPAEKNITKEAVYWGSMLACAEMIKNGVTSFCDMYLFAHQVAEAVSVAGLRAKLGEVIYDFPSPSYGELENGFAWTRDLIQNYAKHPRISGVVMPHAAYTCSPELLQRAEEISRNLNADLNIHLAETRVETDTVLERYGKRPLAHLDALGLVNQRLWIDHGVHLDQGEIERLAEAGVRVAHCPESNMKLASGAAPVPAMLKAGVRLGLGTDGAASNNDLDLLGEMDSAAKLHKVTGLDPTAAPAEDVLAMATCLGGEAFGQPGLGVLAVGHPADVMVIDTNQPHLTPLFNPYSQVVYSARGGDVIHTVCHGKLLMENRRLLTLDQAEVMAKAREQAELLRKGA